MIFNDIDFLLPSLLISVHFLSSLGEEIISILFCFFSPQPVPLICGSDEFKRRGSFRNLRIKNDFFTLATKVSGVKIK